MSTRNFIPSCNKSWSQSLIVSYQIFSTTTLTAREATTSKNWEKSNLLHSITTDFLFPHRTNSPYRYRFFEQKQTFLISPRLSMTLKTTSKLSFILLLEFGKIFTFREIRWHKTNVSRNFLSSTRSMFWEKYFCIFLRFLFFVLFSEQHPCQISILFLHVFIILSSFGSQNITHHPRWEAEWRMESKEILVKFQLYLNIVTAWSTTLTFHQHNSPWAQYFMS